MQSPRLTPTTCPALKIVLLHCPTVNKTFTKLNLAHAYQQIPLAEDAQNLTTINTHKGLFQHTRLPFGVTPAPALFQQHPLGHHQHLWWHPDDRFNRQRPSEDVWWSTQPIRGHWCMSQNIDTWNIESLQKNFSKWTQKSRSWRCSGVMQCISAEVFPGSAKLLRQVCFQLLHCTGPLHQLLQKRVAWTWGPEQQAFNQVKSALIADQGLKI